MSLVSVVCYLCVGLISRPEDPYRVSCVCECDHEASIMCRPWPSRGGCVTEKEIEKIRGKNTRQLRCFPQHDVMLSGSKWI